MQHLLVITGILTRASEAKEKTEEAQEKEGLELAVTSSQMEDVNTLEITEEKLSDAIKQQFGNNKNFSITDNEDGSFLVSMNDTQRMYYIDETGKIIDQSKMLKISTADELKAFRNDVNSGNTYDGWYVYLENDITLDINEEWEPIGLYLMENSSPADETNKPFKGIFDGMRNEINGISINTTNKVQGFFGLVIDSTIKNLGIGKNCNISGGNATAGLVGYLYNNSEITNCYNETDVNAQDYIMVGGIAGQVTNNCVIENSYNSGTINGDSHIGGIAGNLDNNSTVDSCYNIGNITANNYVGGILGDIQNKSIVINCYNIGIITGNNRVGGVVGFLRSTSQKGKNCYYLENTVNGINDSEINGNEIKSTTSDGLKKLSSILGKNFTEDTNIINNGYPILQWQYIY